MLLMILCFSLFLEYFYCCWHDNQGTEGLNGPLSLGNTNDNFPLSCVSLHCMSNSKSFSMREIEEKFTDIHSAIIKDTEGPQEDSNCAFLICGSLSRSEGIKVWEARMSSCLLLHQSLISRASVWEIAVHSA